VTAPPTTRPPARSVAFRAVRAGLLAVLLGTLMLLTFQRKILFPAPPPRALSQRFGALVEGRSPGGRRVAALWAPRPGASATTWTAVYFHGNGMQLADCAELAPTLHAEGFNLFAVEYPGYGPLAGDDPSEAALVETSAAAVGLLRERFQVPTERTLLLGQSLGTGIAVQLAARGMGARVVLLTPYRSITAVAGELFPWLPVRWLVRDRFDSESLAPSVTVPVQVVHGTDDEVIPFAHGEALARLFPRGTLVRVPGGHHNDLWSEHPGAISTALRAR
jgi:pimeloyl-ACP methyl ester carboxylesterase